MIFTTAKNVKRIWTENLFENYHRKVATLYCEVVATQNVSPNIIAEFHHIMDGDPIYTSYIYYRNM